MATNCCQLVGNFSIDVGACIISISSNCSTEITNACGDNNPLAGPTTQTVNIAGYASSEVFHGCPSRAGVSIPWIRKYDCENDLSHFIFSGEGQAFVAGDFGGLVYVKYPLVESCPAVSASSSSGPTGVYMAIEQINGYGLVYDGLPFKFETNATQTTLTLSGDYVDGLYYLQNFNLEAQPGQLPIASYTLVKSITRD